MTDSCALVADLLPLHTDHLLSEPSEAFVHDHLAHCPACAARLAALSQPAESVPPQGMPLRRLKKALLRQRLRVMVLAACVCAAVLLCAFSYLTAPQLLPYSEDLLMWLPLPGGKTVVILSDAATGCMLDAVPAADGESVVYSLCAYTTLWDRLFSPRGEQAVVISGDSPYLLTYAPNPGGEDVLLIADSDCHVITLPRLALTYYFLLALLLSLILAFLRVLLRKTAAAPMLTNAALLPLCYLAAQLCIKGVHFTTHLLTRDLLFILLLTLCFYLALFAGRALWRQRRSAL